jgi:predicted adenine nucleotide alpha hydrolase (AANH) superfamily ATPase
VLRKNRHDVTGYFFNHNIHPFSEYKKRLDALKDYAQKEALDVIYDESYDIEEFLQKIAFNERNRCRICYLMRLESTAILAEEGGYDAFTTTMLYSKYQDHEMVKSIGMNLSKEYDVKFFYEDFRAGWGRGIKMSKKIGMYRQQYCGCIYSERERYFNNE